MDLPTRDSIATALPRIASLITKSEKAQQKLTSGTWQHTMLEGNLRALRLAHSLMTGTATASHASGSEQLRAALRTLKTMKERCETTLAKFAAGSSQHSLQRNRLEALRIAELLIAAALDDSPPPSASD